MAENEPETQKPAGEEKPVEEQKPAEGGEQKPVE